VNDISAMSVSSKRLDNSRANFDIAIVGAELQVLSIDMKNK
jgi:hypothetical protein